MELAAIIIAAASLIVTAVLALRQEALQRRLAAIEEARRAEEVAVKRRADVTASFPQSIGSKGRPRRLFALKNIGAAMAEKISFELCSTTEHRAPIVVTQGHEIPIPTLDPGQEYSFPTVVALGTSPSVDVVIQWEDYEGPKEKTSPQRLLVGVQLTSHSCSISRPLS